MCIYIYTHTYIYYTCIYISIGGPKEKGGVIRKHIVWSKPCLAQGPAVGSRRSRCTSVHLSTGAAHIYVCIYIYIYIYVLCVHIYICIYIYIYICVFMLLCIYKYTYIYIYIYFMYHIYIYIYIYIHTYTCTHTHTTHPKGLATPRRSERNPLSLMGINIHHHTST